MSIYYKNKTVRTQESGFTLVELSIVLVIIGFLIAGIAAATSMVKQAELRSVITDFRNFSTAYNNFSNGRGVPGDWDKSYPTFSACVSAAECNGDNDGLVEYAATAANEVNKAWRVLALSGNISGSFVDNATGATEIGTNAPASKVAGAGFFIQNGLLTNTLATFNFSATQNAVILGKSDGGTPARLINASLIPEDAYNLDVKMDDGRIDGTNFIGYNTGTLMAGNGQGATAAGTACISTTVTSYNIPNTANACLIGYALN